MTTAQQVIASRSHSGTFGFLFRQPAQIGERWSIRLQSDLPGIRLLAGDRLTIKPQRKWDCDALYLLESGELARVSFSGVAGSRRVIWQDGRAEQVPTEGISAMVVGVVEDTRRADGCRV